MIYLIQFASYGSIAIAIIHLIAFMVVMSGDKNYSIEDGVDTYLRKDTALRISSLTPIISALFSMAGWLLIFACLGVNPILLVSIAIFLIWGGFRIRRTQKEEIEERKKQYPDEY